MIVSFRGQGTEDIYNRIPSSRARKTCPEALWTIAQRKLDQINQAAKLIDLRVPPGNRLEALKRERAGQHGIRVNDQYRVCFRWTEAGAEDVEVADYH